MNSATELIHCRPCLGRAGGTFKRGQRTKVDYVIRGSFAAADHIHRDQMWPRSKYSLSWQRTWPVWKQTTNDDECCWLLGSRVCASRLLLCMSAISKVEC